MAVVNKHNRTRLNMERRLVNLARMGPTGLARPSSALDKKAMDLGVYDIGYHCANRKKRKSLVSQALSASKTA